MTLCGTEGIREKEGQVTEKRCCVGEREAANVKNTKDSTTQEACRSGGCWR